MKLEEMSAEELVSYRDDCREFLDEPFRSKENIDSYNDASKELISRLTRGDKAIKAMESLIALKEKYYEEHLITASEYSGAQHKIIEQYRMENSNYFSAQSLGGNGLCFK
jgi:hypothetical protein